MSWETTFVCLKVNGTTLSHQCLQMCEREGVAACGPKAKSSQDNKAIDGSSGHSDMDSSPDQNNSEKEISQLPS